MSTTSGAGRKEYVLGTGEDELARLALQHRLWSDAAHEAWKRAGIKPGMRVLDVGCGPGFASFDLAQLVREGGEVVGVDESAVFVEHLNRQAAVRGLPQLRGVVGDVQKLSAAVGEHGHRLKADDDRGTGGMSSGEHGHPLRAADDRGTFDIAYARWVLCFVADPAAVVRGVAGLLKPGGRFVVHDYFNYETMCLAPRRESYAKAVAATAKSWRDRGGDPDIAGRLPGLMREAGLKVTYLNVHQRVARPDETMYVWPDVWWRLYGPKLVTMGYLSQSDCDQLMRDLDEFQRDPDGFAVLPPVFEVIGEKD